MKYVLFLSLFLITTIPSDSRAAVEVRQVTTSHGVTALLVEDHVLPLITFQILFEGGGYANDPQEMQGRALLASALLDEGAGEFDAHAFKEQLEDRAIRLEKSINADQLSIRLTTLREHRGEAIALLRKALAEPRFDPDAVARVRQKIHALRERNEARADYQAERAWDTLAFAGSAYAQSQYGTQASVDALTEEDLRTYMRQFVTAENAIVSVAGDITAKELQRLLDSLFAPLAERTSLVSDASGLPLQHLGRLEVVPVDVPQSVILFGHEGIHRTDPDFFPAYILNHILGSGTFTSRLMKALRVEEGLTYGISTSLMTLDRATVFVGQVSTRNETADKALTIVRNELIRLKRDGVTAEELQAAKSYLTGAFPLNLDTNAKISSYLNGIQLYDLGLDYLDKRNAYIEAVTLEQVNAVAGRMLQPRRMLVVVAGQPGGLTPSAPEE